MKMKIERFLLVALCVGVGWFYLWTVRSNGDPWVLEHERRDHYNRLIDGWLSGQLHLKVDVPEALLKLKDPYDPAARPAGLALHDASFFRGKYYLYFGAAPVVTLMLPFRIVTGMDMPLGVAVLVFVYGGFAASVAIWLAARRRYFPESGTWVALAGVGTLGLAALGPVLLRRPHMWELPIGAGYCFAMLALWCAWRSLHAEEVAGRARWFAGAGLCLGLAIASRPTYLIASPFLAVPALWWWRSEGRAPWRAGLGALTALALIGGAMAWHNQARFGDPLQFGQAYQLSMDYESKMAHFRAGHAPFNVWRYFFSAAEWTRYFPFVRPAELPAKPPGFGGHDDVYGVLRNMPVAWLALAVPLALWRRERKERGPLATWLAMTAVLFLGMAGTLVCFFGSLARYQSDFTPALMLLAVVGLAGAERWLRIASGGAWRAMGNVAMVAAAGFAMGFAVLFSLQLDGFFEERNPAYQREVARWWNRLPAAWERLTGTRHGPLELTLRLGEAPVGARHALLTVGSGAARDRVFARWVEGGKVSFEIESAHGARHATPAVEARPGASLRLRLSMGSLLPPESHPGFGHVSKEVVSAVARRLKVEADGRTLADVAPWFAAAPGPVTLAAERFPGEIVASRRDEEGIEALTAEEERRAGERLGGRGAIRLKVTLPAGRSGKREPLVVTGRPGRGDLVSIEYGESGVARFAFDHWGGELRRSGPVALDFGAEQEITVAMGSLRERRSARDFVIKGVWEIVVNGRSVWREEAEFYSARAAEIAVGRNSIGGTSCEAEFTGRIGAVEAVAR